MAYHNLSNITDNVGFTQATININESLNSLPFIGFTVLLWIAIFIYAINRSSDSVDSIIISSFVVSIIQILGYFAGFIAKEIIIIPLLLLFLGVIIRMSR